MIIHKNISLMIPSSLHSHFIIDDLFLLTLLASQMVKTYYITKELNNLLPVEFTNSLNKRYISFQYCRATCDGYLDGETEVHASFIQRDEYCDSLVWYANVVPPDDNRKYEFIGTNRQFHIWFTDTNGNTIEPDNFTLFLKLEY